MNSKTTTGRTTPSKKGNVNKAPGTAPRQGVAVPASPAASPTSSPASRQDAQTERRLRAQEAAMRRERQESVRNLGILVAVFLVLGGGALVMYLREALKPGPPGEEVPLMQSYHLTSGDDAHPAYTTDPPTSGPHVGKLAAWGVHSEPITKELQIHSLEDAGIVINYLPDLDQPTVDRLAALTRSYSELIVGPTEENPTQDNHVLMAPYPGLSHPIVLTAWRHIDYLDRFDEARIRRFIDAYKNIDHHIESGDRPDALTPSPGP